MNLKPAVVALLVAVGVWLIAPAPKALGHANYSSSTPGFGAVLTPPAPTQVDVFFTQNLNLAGPNSLNVELLPGMTNVDNNDMVIDPSNHKHMTITLQGSLAFGTYQVDWTTTSAEDGHTASGAFQFQYLATVGGITSLANPAAASLNLSDDSGSNHHLLIVELAAVAISVVSLICLGVYRAKHAWWSR